MELMDSALVTSWVIGYPVLVFCYSVVRQYHSKKPPGLQTLLSKSSVLLASLLPVWVLHWILIFIWMKFLSPVSELTAIFLQISGSHTTCSFLITMILMVIIKYLSIFKKTSMWQHWTRTRSPDISKSLL